MATCTPPNGCALPSFLGLIPGIDGFVSEWMPLIINTWIAFEMLDAQEDAEAELEAIAQTSLDASEDLFNNYMDFREKDQEVYDFQNTQPLYTACNRDKHAIQAARQSTDFIKATMNSVSRFDCGAKQKAIRAAQRNFILATMNEKEQMAQYELSIEDQYLENHYDAIISAASGRGPSSISRSFNSSASLWEIQYNAASSELAGNVASIGYFGGNALGGFFGRRRQPTVGYNSNVNRGGNGYQYAGVNAGSQSGMNFGIGLNY